MARQREFSHGSFRVLCIAQLIAGGVWTSEAIFRNGEGGKLIESNCYAWDFRDPEQALEHAAECAVDVIETGSLDVPDLKRVHA